MPKTSRPRYGSLQFWPRKRITRALPRVNWVPVSETPVIKEEGVLGLVGYKVGMSTAVVRDNTDKSMTKGRKIFIPVTILEVPNMKIFSVRFYNNGQVTNEVVTSNDKELKRKIKVPKEVKKFEHVEKFDDIFTVVSQIEQ